MIEDTYINSQNKSQPTYKVYKDLLLMYLLGLTGQQIIEFKIKYIDAFNYIE
jgi:phage regulator Rha-like protein